LQPCLSAGSLDVYALVSKIALRTMAEYIGLQVEEITLIRRLIDAYYRREAGHQGTTTRGLQALEEVSTYIRQLIRHYRANPPATSSHISSWLQCNVDNRAMSEDEIFFSIFALVITGTDTLPLTTAATLYYLSLDSAAMDEVRGNPDLIPRVFAEAARFDQPTNILGRVLTEDVVMHGKAMKKGQAVLFLYASANRDEREFEQADQFQLHRNARRNLSFGAGLHFCLGQHLAKMVGRVILEELFSQLGEFEVDRTASKRVFGEFLQGFCQLPIHFGPRP
jgi:cytochrome P450